MRSAPSVLPVALALALLVRTPSAQDVGAGEVATMPPGAVGVAQMLGKPIFNVQGLAVATVYDVVLDADGRAVLAILSVDPAGEAPLRLVSVGWDRLMIGQGPAGLMVEVPEEDLISAPPFEYARPTS